MTDHDCCCQGGGGERTRPRSDQDKKKLLNRLSRIEGQVRGLACMVEKDAYCPQILDQVAAATAALDAFGREILAAHLRGCVAEDIRAGHDETIDELLRTLQRLMH